jgi:general secretion pathway protein K
MGLRGRRGGALIAVLWLAAALAAIAFALASTVRGELARTSTQLDGNRAYFLATGALERALVYMQWGARFRLPDGSSRYFSPWTTRLHFSFATGEADVEVMPESSRLNVNQASPEDLLRLLAALGVEPDRAAAVTMAIVDWRRLLPEGGLTEFDRYYLSLTPSFPSRHASFREKEELLLVKGMSPDLYYGSFRRERDQLRPEGGLSDCVTVFGDPAPVDVNSAPPAVLAAVGVNPQAVETIVQARREVPFRSIEPLRGMGLPDVVLGRLGIGGNSVFTLRATARGKTPDGKPLDAARSVGATVRLEGNGAEAGYQVLHWDDRLWVREGQ